MAPTPLPTESEAPWPEFDLPNCPDEESDKPRYPALQPLRNGFPPLFLGCAPFSQIYVSESTMRSDMPLRVTRLALRYGINAFDTSPSYHPSELILSRALSALSSEFPRDSYKLITKCGKYGPGIEDHIITPEMIRLSVDRSLRRFETNYLDVVYIHDVEYTSSLPIPPCNPTLVFSSPSIAKSYGLSPEDKGKIWGEGDQKILNALKVLKELKEEGKIKMIGICGYPLPTLLRLCTLSSFHSLPIDIIQSYSHLNLQNASLLTYLPHLQALGVQVVNASPLNMGLLTMKGMPGWHPANEVKGMVEVTERVKEYVNGEGGKLEDLAVRFGMRDGEGEERVPVVVGCADLDQVHSAVSHYIAATTNTTATTTSSSSDEDEVSKLMENHVVGMYEEVGLKDWSWKSGL